MTLTPAYSRDYKSKKELLAALNGPSPHDFVIADIMHPDSGRYVSGPELPDNSRVGIRYKKLTQQAFFTKTGGIWK